MPGVKSKIKKATKVAGVVTGVIILISLILAFVVYRMEDRSFPLESLDLKDAKLFEGSFESRLLSGNFEKGGIDSFQVRVTNKESFGAKKIKIKINFYNKEKTPIDGVVFTLYGVVPAMSTRLLHCNYLGIKALPPEGEWTSDLSVLDAKRTWIFDASE